MKLFTDENNFLICPKVGWKDLFDVKDAKKYTFYLNKISKKHIVFLVCDNTLKPKYVIEIDDKSYEKEK